MFKFKLAEAFVEMTAKDGGLVRTLTSVDTQMQRVMGSVARVAAIGAALAGIGAPFIAAAKLASNYEDALSRMRVKFSQLTDQDMPRHEEAAREIALAYGATRAEVLDLATSM